MEAFLDIKNILRLLAEVEKLEKRRIHLIPSENRLSPTARIPLGMDIYSRYFFNDEERDPYWEFRGGRSTSVIESAIAIPTLCRLGNVRYANIRPLSGMSAMWMVITALSGMPGSTVVSISPQSGGHFATQSVVERIGRRSKTVSVHHGSVDLSALENCLRTSQVALVYLDLQNSLSELSVRPVADLLSRFTPSPWLHVDCSHTLGLILGGQHDNPIADGANSFGGSTHKTFPGPHKGVIFTDSDEVAEKIRCSQMEMISNHNHSATVALGITAAEFESYGAEYARNIVANAQVFASELHEYGFDTAGALPLFTRTHQVWVSSLSSEEIVGIANTLEDWGIVVNIQMDLPGSCGPSLRLGVNEATFEGATAESMKLIAKAFHNARCRGSRILSDEIRESYGSPYYWVP